MQPALKLSIAQPCSQHWENMTPSSAGNYCASCQKNVVDFTGMSDQEIHHYFHRATGPVVGASQPTS